MKKLLSCRKNTW